MLHQRRQLLRLASLVFGSGFIFGRTHAAVSAQTPAPTDSSPKTHPEAGTALNRREEMEKVTGIGGLFFRAHDPAALGRWYQEHLGVTLTPAKYDDPVWEQEAGPTVFSPFPESTKYFGDPQKMWMVNFRVRDLDKMAGQLRAAGSEVKIDPQTYPNGRFARLHDPEGNPIELWQPAAPPSKG
jgi:predicted enzyme related to lactoylglutathione lyase